MAIMIIIENAPYYILIEVHFTIIYWYAKYYQSFDDIRGKYFENRDQKYMFFILLTLIFP